MSENLDIFRKCPNRLNLLQGDNVYPVVPTSHMLLGRPFTISLFGLGSFLESLEHVWCKFWLKMWNWISSWKLESTHRRTNCHTDVTQRVTFIIVLGKFHWILRNAKVSNFKHCWKWSDWALNRMFTESLQINYIVFLFVFQTYKKSTNFPFVVITNSPSLMHGAFRYAWKSSWGYSEIYLYPIYSNENMLKFLLTRRGGNNSFFFKCYRKWDRSQYSVLSIVLFSYWDQIHSWGTQQLWQL